MISNSILNSAEPTTRSGVQWHSLRVAALPEPLQVLIRKEDPEAGRVVWCEQDARWHTYSGALSPETSSAVLAYVIRQRRAEPHLAFQNGHVFYYLDPESSYCTLDDLEANLEGQNRYAGGVRWTVGQHWRFCVALAEISCEREHQPPSSHFLSAVKHHDHAEGAVHDLNVGLKRAMRALWSSGQSEYDELEARADAWVRRRLVVPLLSEGARKLIKEIDVRAAWIEMQQLGFPDYFVEEAAEGQAPVLPEEIAAFKRIQGENRAS